ncbi:hypothetical protein BD324DRAFT_679149 [Kockovaella imperatae]|uniref:Uncharacterized protein n=1 Tax=Kockovaella imperatae TaxID=4999 RepID=A0A1Y1UPY4_9TREE|nr:hypothetical protein BD324DRAFT_679149 [Kockovaella imperatae]ORX40091.1 hypothetical protein BD324DRAFT_679149 [Kockovaella imperatae]
MIQYMSHDPKDPSETPKPKSQGLLARLKVKLMPKKKKKNRASGGVESTDAGMPPLADAPDSTGIHEAADMPDASLPLDSSHKEPNRNVQTGQPDLGQHTNSRDHSTQGGQTVQTAQVSHTTQTTAPAPAQAQGPPTHVPTLHLPPAAVAPPTPHQTSQSAPGGTGHLGHHGGHSHHSLGDAGVGAAVAPAHGGHSDSNTCSYSHTHSHSHDAGTSSYNSSYGGAGGGSGGYSGMSGF